MKKKLLILFSLLLIVFSGIKIVKAKLNTEKHIKNRFSVYNYIPNQADISYWSKTIFNEYGTLEENLQKRFSKQYKFIEEIPIKGMPKEIKFDDNFGAIPKRPTEFKTNLAEQKTEGHSGTTLKVTSITTKDNNTLSADILGDLIVLSVNPGASNAETVVCTGLTVATKTFTGCVFGYRFDDPTTTQASNIKSHSPGEPIIISNTDTYLSQQYVTIDGDTTILGKLTIASSTSPLANRLYLSSTTPAYLEANAGVLYYCNNGASCAAIGAGSNTYAFERPIITSGSSVKFASSTYDFTLRDNLFAISTSTISSGTASGKAIEDHFNARYNATTTKDNLTLNGNTQIASTTLSSNVLITGNTTTTGSFIFSGSVSGITNLATSTTATTTVANSSAETTIFSQTIPSNTLETDGVIKVRINISDIDSTVGHNPTYRLKYGNTTLIALLHSMTASTNFKGYIEAELIAANSTSQQKGSLFFITMSSAVVKDTNFDFGTSNEDSAAAKTLSITVAVGSADATDSFSVGSAYMEILK